MTMSSITVRIDEQTKEAATKIAVDFGFDLSSVTRAFYKQMVRENRIPLNLRYPNPSSESLASIKEADDILSTSKGGFTNADEMFDDLGI